MLQELPQDARDHCHAPRNASNVGAARSASTSMPVGDFQRGEAQVLRLRQHIPGEIIGSYSVILIVTG